MSEELRVYVVQFKGRRNLYLRAICPDGKTLTKSAKTRQRREAERAAGQWRTELERGEYKPVSRISWAEFRAKFEDAHATAHREQTQRKNASVFNSVEQHIRPGRLRDMTTAKVAEFAAKLGAAGRSRNTVRAHLRHLKAALRWAHRQGLLAELPHFEIRKRDKTERDMRGRPLVGEEFDRMLAAVPSVVTRKIPDDLDADQRADLERRNARIVESWRHLLRGLWLSGLRLGEALALEWDRDDRPCIDLSGRRPLLHIPGEYQKAGRDTVTPITPDFFEFLDATPESERSGLVFNPLSQDGTDRLSDLRIGGLICEIGKKAAVKVSTHPDTGHVKFASAHDLRRSFGQRWASKVMPTVLMQLMRHQSVETSMRYYAGRSAEAAADALWKTTEAPAEMQPERRASWRTDPETGESDGGESTQDVTQSEL